MRHLLTLCMILCVGVPSLRAQDKFLGKTAAGWAAQLKSADAKERRAAAFAIGKMGVKASGAVAPMKTAYAGEKDARVRDAIVFGLAELCRDKAVFSTDTDVEKLFLGAAGDEDGYVRRSAVYGLGCLASKSQATRAVLEKALDDKEAYVRQNAAFALAQFAESALPAIQKALRDEDSLVKRDAASVLLTMSDGDKVHEILKDLLPLCRDTNSEVRRAALNVLVRIVDAKDTEAIPSLRAALDDQEIENRRNAAMALSNIGGEETAVALPVLLEAAKNGDAELRPQAVLAIRNIGKAAGGAVPELTRFLRTDKDAKVREYAALALGGIGKSSEQAVPVLLSKIQDSGEVREVRIECAMALARIGPVNAAKDIVPALLDVLGDRSHDAKVRERVMWSLRVHGGNLRAIKGPHETFVKIMNEPLNTDNKMLRYDCAYMLGMIWQSEAPNQTIDRLLEFLNDKDVKVYLDTSTTVGGGTIETKGAKESIKERGQGDGRVMAADALLAMGATKYAGRADLMKQLRYLAANATYAPLREKASKLVKDAQ